tara:strand:+ start:453 stop:1100 length:648 start_codon:yes stop_codon:yes gene_type:complete
MKKELKKRILSSIIIIPLSLFFIIKGSNILLFFLLTLFLISSKEWLKMVKKFELKFFGVVFLLISFYTAFHIRDNNLGLFLIILIICISTDIGGYFFGKLLKGPKLSKISPNKTFSGMIGGFLLAIIFSHLFGINYNYQLIYNVNNIYGDSAFFILVLAISFVSQIGDLIISYFKRISKIKNTGKIFPGHGGLLDRIDGMIFVFPFCYLFIKTFS